MRRPASDLGLHSVKKRRKHESSVDHCKERKHVHTHTHGFFVTVTRSTMSVGTTERADESGRQSIWMMIVVV